MERKGLKLFTFLSDTSVWGEISAYSEGGALLLEAAELELVLGSSAIPPPSRNMVTAISRLLLHASNICFPTLSVAPRRMLDTGILIWSNMLDKICNAECNLMLVHHTFIKQRDLKSIYPGWSSNFYMNKMIDTAPAIWIKIHDHNMSFSGPVNTLLCTGESVPKLPQIPLSFLFCNFLLFICQNL